jgi:hypothetical protein
VGWGLYFAERPEEAPTMPFHMPPSAMVLATERNRGKKKKEIYVWHASKEKQQWLDSSVPAQS